MINMQKATGMIVTMLHDHPPPPPQKKTTKKQNKKTNKVSCPLLGIVNI